MCIIFTNHAIQRIKERSLEINEIINVVKYPDEVTPDKKDEEVSCYKKIGDNFLILVYAKDDEGNIVVITAYKTSKISKYL